MAPSGRDFDVVIYGATGFTGEWVAREALLQASGASVALAGRSEAKLHALAQALAAELCLREPPAVLVADAEDAASLDKLCVRAKVVVSCVGPYRFWGEPVVSACVRGGADYIDISGEPEFIERIAVDYGKAAKEAGVLVVSACGFDSIPCDMGTLMAAQALRDAGGVPRSVEAYISMGTDDGRNVVGHYPTWQCAVMGVGAAGELRTLRRRAKKEGSLPPPAPVEGPKLKIHRGWHRVAALRPARWAFPFIGSDASIIRRTMGHLASTPEHAPPAFAPVQAAVYLTVSSRWYMWLFTFFGALFKFLAQRRWGRKLLLKYPSTFSNGAFSRAGPSKEDIEHTNLRIDFIAKGTGGGGKVHCALTGPEPGYALCSRVCAAAALTLADASERGGALPEGGVVTAGVAFCRTALMKRCAARGVRFECLSKED